MPAIPLMSAVQEIQQVLERAFPEQPAPSPEAAIGSIKLYPDDLAGLLGRTWVEVLSTHGEVLPEEMLWLSEEGLRYYLPFFVWRALEKEANYEYYVPKFLMQRADVLTKPGFLTVDQRAAVIEAFRSMAERSEEDLDDPYAEEVKRPPAELLSRLASLSAEWSF